MRRPESSDPALLAAIVFGCFLAARVLVAVVERAWARFRAPMRRLTEDVIAIRERLEQVEGVGAKKEGKEER